MSTFGEGELSIAGLMPPYATSIVFPFSDAPEIWYVLKEKVGVS
jgi:hypothetical protein